MARRPPIKVRRYWLDWHWHKLISIMPAPKPRPNLPDLPPEPKDGRPVPGLGEYLDDKDGHFVGRIIAARRPPQLDESDFAPPKRIITGLYQFNLLLDSTSLDLTIWLLYFGITLRWHAEDWSLGQAGPRIVSSVSLMWGRVNPLPEGSVYHAHQIYKERTYQHVITNDPTYTDPPISTQPPTPR